MNKKTKILGLLLSSAIALHSVPVAAANDISGHWAEKIILEMQSKNIISGYDDGSFKPDEKMTRAEFVKIVNRAFGMKGSSNHKFIDVNPQDWFAVEVAIALANEYLKGFPDGSFKPNAVISRAEVAVILARILKVEEDASSADKFTDSAQIPTWAKGSIGALAKAGYLKGYPDGSFGADKSVTRSEAFSSVYAPSKDHQTKEDAMKKENAKKLEEAKKKEAEKAKKQTPQSSSSGTNPSNPSTPSPQPEKKNVESITFTEKNFDITAEAGQITVTVNHHPANANNKGVRWEITAGSEKVMITEQSAESITLTALDNGNYEVSAILKANPLIKKSFTGTISGQVVTVTGIGTAGDKSIQGLTAGKAYLLETDGKYHAVNAKGIPSTAFDHLDQAKANSVRLDDGITAITGLDNTKSYVVAEISDTDLLFAKVNAYLEISVDSIHLKNMEEIDQLGQKLIDEVQTKIEELQEAGKEKEKMELENLFQNSLTPKKQELDAKIESLSKELEQKMNSVIEQLTFIVAGLDAGDAENIISVIETYKADLPDAVWTNIPDTEKYTKLKTELTQYHAFTSKELVISDSGEISMEIADFTVSWKLLKEKGSNYQKISEGDSLAQAIPSQLQMMRKSGVGNYKIQLTSKHDYLASKSRESQAKAVKLLLSHPGTLELDETLSIKVDNPNVRIDWENGYLEWDAIDHATTYDIRADIADLSQEGFIGGEYLEITPGLNDNSNIENEFEKSELRRSEKWFLLDNKSAQRVFVAIGLNDTKVSLNKFIPFVGANFNPDASFDDNADVFVKIWIIPRNQDGLYISDMNERLENKSNSDVITPNQVNFRKFLQKFKIIN